MMRSSPALPTTADGLPVRLRLDVPIHDADASRRALGVFPGGSNGEFALPADLVTVLARGEGCRVWDHAGREMLDFSMGWGTALVGHARPEVVAAVRDAIGDGGNFAALNTRALALAERLTRLCPGVQRVRFCASGTEATSYAVQLARAYTARPAVLKCEGAYHGANVIGTASLFPAPGASDAAHTSTHHAPHHAPQQATPTSHGFADDLPGRVFHCPFNNTAAAVQAIDRLGDRLAAVIVEPLHRCTPPEPGFLEALADAARQRGALLIYDEVVTGFRLALGGAQAYFQLAPQHRPDLVAYGKALGGGTPIGVLAGRADVLELVNEHRLHDHHNTRQPTPYVWFASSLGGNPVSCAAALATLNILETPGTYETLHNLGRQLRQRIDDVLQHHRLPARAIGDGPLAQIAFHTGETHQSAPNATRLRQLLLTELFRRGVFVNPMGTKLYLSLAHTQHDLDAFAQRLHEAAQVIA